MSVHTKKNPTNKLAHIIWHGKKYAIPQQILDRYRVGNPTQTLSIKQTFSHLLQDREEPAIILKGLRAREGLTQIEFAKKIGVTQTNQSAMENGRRPIGKDIAKRIQKKFGVDYRLFLA